MFIDISYPRTGTRSLEAAMSRLGFTSTHGLGPDSALLYDYLSCLLSSSVANSVALTLSDHISHTFSTHYHSIAKKYPNSRFILLIRDRESWADSVRRNLVLPNAGKMVLDAVTSCPGNLSETNLYALYMSLQWISWFGSITYNPGWVERYHSHNTTAPRFLSYRLLVLRLQTTPSHKLWSLLKDFTGSSVEIPRDEPFPHIKDEPYKPE